MKHKKLWRVGHKEVKYIKEVIDSGLTGKLNKRFEEKFAERLGVKYAIGVNSGTSALHASLAAIGIKPGDEVIVPPLTFAATAFSVLYLGAVPIFADIDPDTFTIDAGDIKRKLTNRTKAIIPVSLYGLPVDYDPIMKIARENNLKVIEDDAQCLLGKYKGRLTGTIGDMAIFSFERSKHMTTGNGGVIVTNDEYLAEMARKFSILGYATLSAKQDSYKSSKETIQQPDFKRHEFIGFNYRLPEVCAAMALAQLEKLDMLVAKRCAIAQMYSKAIKGCAWLIPQKTPNGFLNSYWTYAAKIDGRISWMNFRKAFLQEGGERYYGAWGIVYLEPALLGMEFPQNNVKYEKGLCPIAEELQPRLIQLKTNFSNLSYAKLQADALRRTIKKLDKVK